MAGLSLIHGCSWIQKLVFSMSSCPTKAWMTTILQLILPFLGDCAVQGMDSGILYGVPKPV